MNRNIKMKNLLKAIGANAEVDGVQKVKFKKWKIRIDHKGGH